MSDMVPISSKHFYLAQVILGAGFLLVAWLILRPKTSSSNFRVREADRVRNPDSPGNNDLANAKMKRNEPLRLSGISIGGLPHEILQISANANSEMIQKAYRDLMKRYHPDLIGRPGSREWQDAQKIAEALNRAKEQMLKGLKKPL